MILKDGPIETRVGGLDEIEAYAAIAISFRVERIIAFHPGGKWIESQLHERVCAAPYTKNYDRSIGGHPTDWSSRFDTSSWGLISAWDSGVRIGGLVLIYDAYDVDLLDGRSDLTVLLDLRVAPEARRKGVGTALLAAGEQWALRRDRTGGRVERSFTRSEVPSMRAGVEALIDCDAILELIAYFRKV